MKPAVLELMDFALTVARRAGQITLEHFQTDLAIETKDDATVVTIADRAAEQLARDMIAARHPNDGILGEEFGESHPGAGRRWILDPIDGTLSYVHGVPLYGVLIAVEESGDPIVGVLHFPALDETVCAARGQGCWWNGRRAEVSKVDRIEQALVLCTRAEELDDRGHGPQWDELRANAAMVRTWGDCYGHALVATGRAEAMLDPVLARWDAAALLPVVEEAGGSYTDWSGRTDHTGGSGISTNAALAAEIRRALGIASGGARPS